MGRLTAPAESAGEVEAFTTEGTEVTEYDLGLDGAGFSRFLERSDRLALCSPVPSVITSFVFF